VLEASGFRYPSRAKRLAFMMCKGGVGKTTSSFLVSQRLASYGARVLAIDTDPQSNLTASFHLHRQGITVHEQTPVLADVISGDCLLGDALIQISPELHLLPSTAYNSLLDQKLSEFHGNPVHVLEQLLQRVDKDYDYIIIDCAPSLNLVNAATAFACETVFLPIELDEFSYLGLEQTISELSDLEKEYDFTVEKRVLLTKLDLKDKVSFVYLAKVADRYRSLVCDSMIRMSHDIRTSISRNENLFDLRRSTAKTDYDNLTKEILGLTVERRQSCQISTS